MKKFLSDFKQKGRTLVSVIDPHILQNEEYHVAEVLNKGSKISSLNIDCLVLDETQKPYVGDCWPGLSNWADFLNPEIKPIYKQLFRDEEYFLESDNLHVWIDMNEPAVFGTEEATLPKDTL